jgi:hypothetical protein
MRVRCKINNIYQIQNSEILERIQPRYPSSEGNEYVNIGQEYTVYGVLFKKNYPWYYIMCEASEQFPIAFPKDLFEVIDDRLSRYWRMGATKLNQIGNEKHQYETRLVIKEWSDNPYFYEFLVDADDEEQRMFNKYKKLMDFEYTPSKENQALYRFIFCGCRPKKSLEEIATLKGVRESKIVHKL